MVLSTEHIQNIDSHQLYRCLVNKIKGKIKEMSVIQKYLYTFKFVPQPTSTTLTSSFRSTTRNSHHNLGIRMNRDVHDLDYKVDRKYSLANSLGNSTIHQSNMSKSKPRKTMINPQSSVFKIQKNKSSQINQNNGISPQNYQKAQLKESTQTLDGTKNTFFDSNNQMMRITASSKILRQKMKIENHDYGLCPFEQGSTILGNIKKRYSHHLNFEKMADRQQNINTIWYSKNQVFSPIDRQKNDVISTIHPFKSDLPHKVFQPMKSLDKIYDSPLKLVKSRSDLKVRKMGKVSKRPSPQIKSGTQLDYEKNRSLLNNKKPIISITRSVRKLKISRQIISPQRGCYR